MEIGFIVVIFIVAFSAFSIFNAKRTNNAFTTEELKGILIDALVKVNEYDKDVDFVMGSHMKQKNTLTKKIFEFSTYVIQFQENSDIINMFFYNTDEEVATFLGTYNLTDTTLNCKLKKDVMLTLYNNNEEIMVMYREALKNHTDTEISYPQPEQFDKFVEILNRNNLIK